MVKTTSATQSIFLPPSIKFASIRASKIVENNYRLDASAYNLEAMQAINKVEKGRYGFVYLWGENGLIDNAYYPGRYKRVYNENNDGTPFYLPSQLEELYPKPEKYIADFTEQFLKNDYIKPNTLLLSRSGTIGKCTIASKATIGKLFSDDVIRITFKKSCDLGYTYAFIKSETGLAILQSNIYGGVIDHIEPEHLRHVPIPNAPDEIKEKIHNLIISSFEKRDQSNDFVDEAQKILYENLQLPPINEIKPKYYDENAGFRNFTVKASDLEWRFDASYHLPEITGIIKRIRDSAQEVLNLENPILTRKIFVGSRFKRFYVEKDEGIVYLNGKSITQLDPNGCNKLYLSASKHGQQIKDELELKKNMILVSCSGTLGRTVMVPEHWDGWAGTHDLIRIVASNDDFAGYLFCYLNSEIGKRLILRNTYGAVIDHIEPEHIKKIPVPILKDKAAMEKINSLVLKANEFRYKAYKDEQSALDILKTEVICDSD